MLIEKIANELIDEIKNRKLNVIEEMSDNTFVSKF